MTEFEGKEHYNLITRALTVEYEHDPQLIHDEGLFRIYGRTDASLWAIVDEEDYHYLIQWRWSYARTVRGKYYIQRRTGNSMKKFCGGFVHMRGFKRGIYLHHEIMARKGDVPPSPAHKIRDHINGNSLDCRRENLRWATISQNNLNRPGTLERLRLSGALKEMFDVPY